MTIMFLMEQYSASNLLLGMACGNAATNMILNSVIASGKIKSWWCKCREKLPRLGSIYVYTKQRLGFLTLKQVLFEAMSTLRTI